MAAPALCRAFSQNAWRRDLCSNCFRSKDEHKAAAAARQKTPSDAARLAATAAVKSILKGSSKSSNSSGKKGRGGVSFHKEESQVIGYGGDDEIHSEDEGNDPELVETPSEADLEREKAEQQELERLTKANTDFNSVVANLQLESITQEKQAAVKSGASGIPVPGGRSPYAGPLRLGLGSKDGDGNKKTLLVSVRPFGSEGEEVSKPVVKTKILVTNGYGNGTNSTGSARESKDSMKPLVNGTITNGIGHSSSNVSKEASVKVNVPPSNGNESKSVATNGVNLIGKGSNIARVTGKSDAAKVNDSNINGKCDQNGARESEEGKGAVLSSVNGEDVSGESVTPSVSSNAVTSSSNVSAPVPANRSFNQQQHSNGGASVVLKNENEKMNEEKSTGDGKIVNGHDSNPPSKNTNPGDGGVGIMPPSKESLNGNNKQKASLVGPSSNIPLASTPKEGSRPGTDGNEVVRQVPIPAERKILLAKPETPLEESAQSLSEAAVNSKANGLVEQEKQLKEKLPVETPSRSPLESLERSSTVEVISREMKEVSMAVNEKICDSLVEEKTIRSSILPVSQMPSGQPLKKAPLSKNVLLKQESQESQKKPEEPSTGKVPLSTKAPNNTISTTPQKPALLSKRPAPSILKMGVPAGWHSKNTSQKNSALIQPAKDSNEEKTMSERANVVNGVIKNQQSTGATVGQEKPLKPVNTIAKLRANFVNNNLKIIAESAAKIVNGTRYGTKNAVADEIPMSKSSVMNLSMRPISTNSRTSGKSFHADDYELKDQRIKGLSNMDKVSNSFPSIRAKGSGPDIRELLRTPEKENENIEFQVHTINQKNPVEPGVLSAKKIGSLDAENIEKPMQYSDEKGIQKEGDMKKLTKEPECHEESSNGSNEVLSESSERSGVPAGENLIPGSRSNQLDLKQTSPQNNIESNKCSDQFEEKSDSPKISSACGGSSSQASPNNAEDTMKAESPAKVENGLDKTPPGEKNRKKGIVRRILFKGGNEIYRKAGEMVRSVRRSNESKDDVESTKEAEAKDTKDHALISKKSLNSKAQGESVITAEIAANPEVTVPFSAEIEEAVNPMVTGIGGGLNEMPMVKQENTSIEALPAEGSVKEISEPPMGVEVDECKGGPMVREESPENTTSTAKSTAEVLESSHPPLMSPRPSFLHGKSFAAQPWSLQSPSRNAAGNSSAHSTPGMRTERAASVSAVLSNHGVTTPSGQRGRLASLPALESEGKSLYTSHSAQGIQITLRKPGPIISGMKPAIPAKPSKILEASSVRQGANQQLSKPIGERKGSTSMQSTPGSVGRSAGKRQAPKPPGMDASQKRKCDPSEMGDCSKEIISSSDGGGVCDATLASNNVGHLPDASQSEQQMDNSAETHIDVSSEDRIEEIKRERLVSLSDGTPEEEIEGYSLNQTSQLTNLSNSGEEEITDDSVLAPRGTHFVKNQALNASKSSSRVARETERRQMLIQLQSTNNRGPVPLPDGSGEVPSAIMQATSNAALSARQRSASLGRGVGVASPRPPLPGGSLGRFAGEGAALTIVTSTDVESPPDASAEMGNHDDVLSHSTSPVTLPIAHDPLNIGENAQQVAASPIRSRSEGSLAVRLPMTPSDDGKLAPGAMIFETPGGVSGMAKGEEVIYDSPSGLSSKKKRHTVRGFLKFLRRGSLRDDPSGTAFENRDEVSVDSEPKTRPVIVHPMELDGACVEVVKGGGIDVRRRLEEENALETTKSGAGGCSASSDQLQSSPRRPTSISIAPPRPPPVMHSPSSPSLSSSSSSSSGSTPIRPRPPPPPRGLAPVPPSPGGSGQKPARPPPPKPAHLMRLGLIDREVPGGSAKNSGDGIYANLGEVRATLAPCKPQRTASMREVLGSTSGKANGEAPTPRVIPRNAMTSSSSSTETPSPDPSSHSPELKTVASSSDAIESTAASIQEVRVPSLDAGNESVKCVDTIETSKSDKLSWNVGAEVSLTPPSGMSGAVGQVDISADSSSEEENSMAPPLPLAPPPSLPPPLPLHPPPSPPSHATSSSSSSSIGNALILPEDSGYESVEFHGAHDSEVNAGRWWAESGITASRASVVTTTADSLEESYEAVVGANHRALADVLAQVCQPNPEEFGTNTTLRWSDFLVEGPKGGVLRSVGPISFHRAALKGRASTSGRDSWRRVTLGISASSMSELPQYFRGCMCHDGNSAPISRCMPSLRPMCTFQDEIPNRFFSSDTASDSATVADLIEATVMVFNPLHFYSLKTYLTELITERKSGQSFPPLPEESNWCNRACLFLLVFLDSLCSLECNGSEDALCVIREEAKPSPVVAAVDGQLGDGSHLSCPLPRLCVLPNENSPKANSSPSSPMQCFQNVVTQIAETTGGDSGMDSFAHVLNCILGLLQGTDDALARSRAALELWFFGPPIFQSIALHSPGDKAMHEEVMDVRDAARWALKSPILSAGEAEPLSVEGELLHATPRRWLDLERAGALRSLAVSALHRGSRIPSPLESGLEGSSTEEGGGVVGKCCRGWRVGEIGGHPTLPTCEEVRLRFLVGTSGSEVAESWELLARNELSSPTSVVSLGRTYVDTPMRKLNTWTISSGPVIGEAQC